MKSIFYPYYIKNQVGNGVQFKIRITDIELNGVNIWCRFTVIDASIRASGVTGTCGAKLTGLDLSYRQVARI